MDRVGSVPNFFYDFIVFVAPTIGIAAGLSLGLTGSFGVIEAWLQGLSATSAVGIALILFFASYEYGRLAETYSDLFVGRVLNLVRALGIPGVLRDPDYRRDISQYIALLPLQDFSTLNHRNSKWTVYFFALYVNPQIGGDLLKRYAWEKLARSSAFSAFILLFISLVFHLIDAVNGVPITSLALKFGSWTYTLAAFLLYVVLCVDYFKRNCWNNDLLISVIPVLIANHESNSEASNTEVKGVVSLVPGQSAKVRP